MATQTESLLVTLDANVSGYTAKLAQADSATEKLSTTTKKSDKQLADFSRRSGMAGIQFQQFIGQIQGGQSAMVALSQQSADLGFVLGAPLLGAVAGISASVVGMLLPALFNSKDAMQLLEKVSEDLKKSLSGTSEGAIELSNSLLLLAKKSEALARLQISSSIFDAEKQIKISSEGIKDQIEGAFGGNTLNTLRGFSEHLRNAAMKTNSSMSEIVEAISGGNRQGFSGSSGMKVSETITAMSSKLKITKEQAALLAVSISDVLGTQSVFNIKKLENSMADLNIETGGSNEKLAKLARDMIPLFDATSNGVDKVNALRIAYSKLNEVIENQNKPKEKVEDSEFAEIGASEADPELLRADLLYEQRLRDEASFLEAMAEMKFTGLETEAELFFKQQEMHQLLLDNKLISEEEFAKAQEVISKKYAKGLKTEEKDVEKTEASKLQTKQNAIRLGMQANEMLFGDNKAIAAGLIVADTVVGIQKSLAINPFDYVNVGIIAATGAMGVASALGASKGGGSSPSAPTGGGGASSPQQDFQAQTSSLDLTDSSAGGSTQQTITFGSDTGDDLVNAIAEALNKGMSEGRFT
tara:strand:+ start:139 stop:1890 length:1752 start_codon:yes stop_codon:yes gene_type:complete